MLEMSVLPFELALTFYFVAVIIGFFELFKGSRITEKLMMAAIGVGFLNHTVGILFRYAEAGHLPITSPHEAASFFAWCIVLLFFALEFRYKVGLLGSFIMPVVFGLMFAAAFWSRELKPIPPTLQSYWLGVHTLCAFLANAAFALAAGTGAMYLVQEHYLKKKRFSELFSRLPDIQMLDYIEYRLISVGFPLLLMAMISGALWAGSAFGTYWRWDPREVFSLVTMLIYATVLHARLIAGWRGRRAAILSIIGFATVLLAFVGVKLLQKGYHVF